MAPKILKSLGTVTCSSVAVVDTFCEEVQRLWTPPSEESLWFCCLLLYYNGQPIRLYLCKSFRNLMRQAKDVLKNVGIESLTNHTLDFIVQCALCVSKK